MRLAALLLFGPTLIVTLTAGLETGNPIAWGFAGGFAAPIAFAFTLAALPTKRPPRKADPAKIARMERELGIVKDPPLVPFTEVVEGWDGPVAVHGYRRASEAPTTVAKPPAERTTEDCPRPEACVISHPCRKCGADKGARCVGDPYGGIVAETAKQYLRHPMIPRSPGRASRDAQERRS